MTHRKPVESWLTDMDGVLVHEGQPVPGAPEFIGKLRASGKPFLILTNNSIYTARDLQARLARIGIDVPESAIWTSALATAQFLDDQRPRGTAYVIGEAGLTTALHNASYRDAGQCSVLQGGGEGPRGRAARPERALAARLVDSLSHGHGHDRGD